MPVILILVPTAAVDGMPAGDSVAETTPSIFHRGSPGGMTRATLTPAPTTLRLEMHGAAEAVHIWRSAEG